MFIGGVPLLTIFRSLRKQVECLECLWCSSLDKIKQHFLNTHERITMDVSEWPLWSSLIPLRCPVILCNPQGQFLPRQVVGKLLWIGRATGSKIFVWVQHWPVCHFDIISLSLSLLISDPSPRSEMVYNLPSLRIPVSVKKTLVILQDLVSFISRILVVLYALASLDYH